MYDFIVETMSTVVGTVYEGQETEPDIVPGLILIIRTGGLYFLAMIGLKLLVAVVLCPLEVVVTRLCVQRNICPPIPDQESGTVVDIKDTSPDGFEPACRYDP
jgi:hypothetical protein